MFEDSMYHSAKTRPQYLLRQLITTSLTAGSLLLMPLVGAAHNIKEDTTYDSTQPVKADHPWSIAEDVTATFTVLPGIATAAEDGTLLYPENFGIPWSYSSLPDFTNTLDYQGSAKSPTVKNSGVMSFTASWVDSNGNIIYEPRAWDISGKNFTLKNDGEINMSAQGIRSYGDNFTLDNNGGLVAPRKTVDLIGNRARLVNNSGATISSGERAVQVTDNDADFHTVIENYGSISASTMLGVVSFSPTDIINYEGGSISSPSYAVYSPGSGTNVTNDGNISSDFGGVWYQNRGNLINKGEISANDVAAINFGNVTSDTGPWNITNESEGSMIATDHAVAAYGGTTFQNYGTVSSTNGEAIELAYSGNTVHNEGDINGRVSILAPGDNAPTIITNRGTISNPDGNAIEVTNEKNVSIQSLGGRIIGDIVTEHPVTSSDNNIEVHLDKGTTLEGNISFNLYEPSTGDTASTRNLTIRQPLQPIDMSEALSDKPDDKTAEHIEQLHANPPQILNVTESVGPGILDLGNYSMSGEVSMSGGTINLLPGYQNNVNFSDDSSDNSFNVASGQNVGAVTLSEQASLIDIQGAVGNINLPDIQPLVQYPVPDFTVNLSRFGKLNMVSFDPNNVDSSVPTVSTYTREPKFLKLKVIDNTTTADVKANVSQTMQMPPMQIQVSSGNPANTITVDMGLGNPYCMSLVGSAGSVTIQDAHSQALTHIPGQMAAFGTDNCHTFVAANSGLLDARYDKLSDKIINLDHKLQDGNTDWLFEVRYQDMRQDTDENQPHANSTILALSKLWHTTRGDWIFQASHDSTHIGQHLNNNSASIVLGHSQKWGKTSKLHMQLGGDRREMSLNLVGEQDTVTESSNYSVVYGEIGMGRVLHKIAGHDINMRMRLAAERIGSFGKGWDSDTISLMIPELSVSGRVLPSVLTDASHRLYGFLQKPMGDTTQKYTITGFGEDTFHYDTDVSGGIGYDLHAGVGANTMLHAKASYLNTGYLSLGLGISQNL